MSRLGRRFDGAESRRGIYKEAPRYREPGEYPLREVGMSIEDPVRLDPPAPAWC
jgi:hypothetical protein